MPVIINGSTGISGVDGTTGTPAVQGTDTNTGMWFPAADEIAFSEGGVEALRLNSSGNAIFSGTVRVGGITADLYPLVLGTAQNSTSGTFVDFTGIPSWARRITVMFNGVSTNGNSAYIVQLGTSSGVVSTGYISRAYAVTTNTGSSTAGFMVVDGVGFTAAAVVYGHALITNVSGNTFVYSSLLTDTGTPNTYRGGGGVTLGGTADRVRITTVGGTDLFDAGSINVMWEG